MSDQTGWNNLPQEMKENIFKRMSVGEVLALEPVSSHVQRDVLQYVKSLRNLTLDYMHNLREPNWSMEMGKCGNVENLKIYANPNYSFKGAYFPCEFPKLKTVKIVFGTLNKEFYNWISNCCPKLERIHFVYCWMNDLDTLLELFAKNCRNGELKLQECFRKAEGRTYHVWSTPFPNIELQPGDKRQIDFLNEFVIDMERDEVDCTEARVLKKTANGTEPHARIICSVSDEGLVEDGAAYRILQRVRSRLYLRDWKKFIDN